MPDPVQLPNEVLQGLGLWPPPPAPPPIDSSLAGMSQDQQIAPAPDVQPAPAPMPVPAPIQAATPAPDQLPPPVTSLPSDTGPGQPPAAPSKDFTVPTTAFGHATVPVPTPQGQPQRPAKPQTFEQGMAAAQAQERAAEGQQKQAIAQTTDVQAQSDAANLAAVKANDAEQKRIAADVRAAQDEKNKIYAEKQLDIDARKKELDSYKVDQGKYWNDLGVGRHIGWYIAMAMSGLGDALQGKSGPNPVIQMLQDKIHQNIQLQMDKRDQMRAALGDARVEQDRWDKFSDNKIAQRLARQGEADRELARQLSISAAQAADPIHRANGLKEAAQVDAQGAQKQQEAVKMAADHQYQMGQLGIAGENLRIARHAEDRATAIANAEYGPGGYKEQEIGIKNNAELLKERADQRKAMQEGAVGNPTTREPFLDKKGLEMRKQAEDLKTRALSDPANAAKLNAQADALREEANATHAFVIHDKEDRRKVLDNVKYGQDTVDTAAKMKKFLQSDPSSWDRSEWAGFQTELGNVLGDKAKALGANASSREFQALAEHVLTIDPQSIYQRTFDKGKMIAQLDHLIAATQRDVNSELGSRMVPEKWVPTSPDMKPEKPLTKDEKSIKSLSQKSQGGLPDSGLIAPILSTIPGMNPAGIGKDEAKALSTLGEGAANQDLKAIEKLSDLAGKAPRESVRIAAINALSTPYALRLPDVQEMLSNIDTSSEDVPDSVRAAARAALNKANELYREQQAAPKAGPYSNTNPGYSPQDLVNRFHRINTPTLPGAAQ
jgi:hypothetical protein